MAFRIDAPAGPFFRHNAPKRTAPREDPRAELERLRGVNSVLQSLDAEQARVEDADDPIEAAYQANTARQRDAWKTPSSSTPTGTAAPVEDANADPIENARQRMIARNLAARR